MVGGVILNVLVVLKEPGHVYVLSMKFRIIKSYCKCS